MQANLKEESKLSTINGPEFNTETDFVPCLKTSSKSYKCKVCDEGFHKLFDLHQHRLTHKGKKSFSCDVCDKEFTRKESLNTHTRIHSNIKPYVCNACDKNTKSILVTDTRIHRNLKPYIFDVCDMRFNFLSSLRRHRVTYAQ